MSAGRDPLESSTSALARVVVARRDQLAFLDAAAKDISGPENRRLRRVKA
jgi:hypothetical protein